MFQSSALVRRVKKNELQRVLRPKKRWKPRIYVIK